MVFVPIGNRAFAGKEGSERRAPIPTERSGGEKGGLEDAGPLQGEETCASFSARSPDDGEKRRKCPAGSGRSKADAVGGGFQKKGCVSHWLWTERCYIY